MATREFGPEDAKGLVENILKLKNDEPRARDRWGSPQNMARTILMTDTTLQFLFHPNVFCDPKAETVRILNLLIDATSVIDRKDALKEYFPIYVSKSRNIRKVHSPLPEIPEILEFWEVTMRYYRKSDREGKPKTLKSVVQLVIADERQKKAAAAAEKNNPQILTPNPPKPIKNLTREKSDGCDKSKQSRKAVTWDSFVNMMTAGFKRLAKRSNNLTIPINMDGGRSADASRIGSIARTNSDTQRLEIQRRIEIQQTVETDSSYREPQTKTTAYGCGY
ncbi:hypothetical protein BJ875DRAFT_522940 [Amylocarpus encephaloides]|uniref:Uncharacterized protein n=1 Tax=Amylocarpus encephaloides TaxID=45428 RepID=A0A9P7YPS1_9HELO|nr:hypothetical protein BJ875DRAFT_522940 [Amylocarpus encephaloides]